MTILESRPIAANETNSGTKDIDHTTKQRLVTMCRWNGRDSGHGKAREDQEPFALRPIYMSISITKCNKSTVT